MINDNLVSLVKLTRQARVATLEPAASPRPEVSFTGSKLKSVAN